MGLLDDAIREHLELKRRRGADASEVSRQESDALGPVRRTAEGKPDLYDLPEPPAAEGPEPAGAHELPAEPAPWEEEQTAVHAPPLADQAYEPPPIPSAPPASSPPEPPAAYEPPVAYAPPAAYQPPAPEPPAPYQPPAPEPPAPAYEPSPDSDPDADFDPFPELADEPPVQPPPAPERGSLLSRFKRRRDVPGEPPADPPAADDGTEPVRAAYEPPPPPPATYAQPPAHAPDIVPADEEPDGEDLLEETPDFLEETPEHDRLWFEQRPPRDFDFDG